MVGGPEEESEKLRKNTVEDNMGKKNQIFWKTYLLIKEAWQTPVRIRMKANTLVHVSRGSQDYRQVQ